MRKFLIEREIPGAENLTPEELQAIAQTSNKAVAEMGEPYHWVQSFVAGDKIYCIHVAEDEETSGSMRDSADSLPMWSRR